MGSDIKSQHQAEGLEKTRCKQSVHKSTETLLAVPRYLDLLEDQYHEDESERGRVLVSSASGWHIEMAKWIAEAREAELEESDDDGERKDVMDDRQCAKTVWKWKPITLALLFGGEKPRWSRLPPEEVDAESQLMEALAELEEDKWLDDGEVEIPSDQEFVG